VHHRERCPVFHDIGREVVGSAVRRGLRLRNGYRCWRTKYIRTTRPSTVWRLLSVKLTCPYQQVRTMACYMDRVLASWNQSCRLLRYLPFRRPWSSKTCCLLRKLNFLHRGVRQRVRLRSRVMKISQMHHGYVLEGRGCCGSRDWERALSLFRVQSCRPRLFAWCLHAGHIPLFGKQTVNYHTHKHKVRSPTIIRQPKYSNSIIVSTACDRLVGAFAERILT